MHRRNRKIKPWKSKVKPWKPEGKSFQEIKKIPYESPILMWDSEELKKEIAYYFGFNGRENFHLFLKRANLIEGNPSDEDFVKMYIIKQGEDLIYDWEEKSGVPIFSPDYLGYLGDPHSDFDNPYERKYALERISKIEAENKYPSITKMLIKSLSIKLYGETKNRGYSGKRI